MQILIEQVLDADHNKIFLATESYCPTLLKHCCSVACKWGIKYKLIHSNLFRWICNRLYTSKTSGTILTEQRVCCKQNWWTSQINVQDISIDNLLTSIHELVTLCSFFDNTISITEEILNGNFIFCGLMLGIPFPSHPYPFL